MKYKLIKHPTFKEIEAMPIGFTFMDIDGDIVEVIDKPWTAEWYMSPKTGTKSIRVKEARNRYSVEGEVFTSYELASDLEEHQN
jgi:hypothetical protein